MAGQVTVQNGALHINGQAKTHCLFSLVIKADVLVGEAKNDCRTNDVKATTCYENVEGREKGEEEKAHDSVN